MRIRISKLLFGLTGIVLLAGCDGYSMVKSPSYVACYVSLETFHLSVEPSDSHCLLVENRGNGKSSWYGLHSTGAEKDRYDELCRKHNDLNYNGYYSIYKSLDIESVTYNDCDFTEIAVTTDRDFDERHPAGTNLSDVVRFMSWSPYRYILSGYSSYYHYDKSDVSEAFDRLMSIYRGDRMSKNASKGTCYPIDKLVKDLAAEDLTLVGGDGALDRLGMLYFVQSPSTEGEYVITVSITTDDGRTLTDSVTMTF